MVKTATQKVIPKIFVYPFPFSPVAVDIVLALEKRGWDVPGVTVEFYDDQNGHRIRRRVSHISGDDFHINYISSTISIPHRQLTVYADGSDPTYHVYVGDDWDADKKEFFTSIKVNSKLHEEPRKYLRYSGRASYTERGLISAPGQPAGRYLVIDTDLNREYDAGPDDQQWYETAEVIREVADWLSENVLARIIATPETGVVDPPPHVLTKFTDEERSKLFFDTLTVLGSHADHQRIFKGINDENSVPLEKRYAATQNTRLVPLNIKLDEGMSRDVHDGFVWASPESCFDSDSLRQSYLWQREHMSSYVDVLTIRPLYRDEVYVVDTAARDHYKADWSEAHPDVHRLTDDAYNELFLVEARTMVPLAEYDGSYERPLVVFHRNVELDEVVHVVTLSLR